MQIALTSSSPPVLLPLPTAVSPQHWTPVLQAEVSVPRTDGARKSEKSRIHYSRQCYTLCHDQTTRHTRMHTLFMHARGTSCYCLSSLTCTGAAAETSDLQCFHSCVLQQGKMQRRADRLAAIQQVTMVWRLGMGPNITITGCRSSSSHSSSNSPHEY